MDDTQRKRLETSPHNTENINQNETFPSEDRYGGARPKTKESQKMSSHKNRRDFNRLWRSKSSIDIDVDFKRPKQFRENNRQRERNLEEQSKTPLGSSTGKLDWTDTQISNKNCRFKEKYKSREPKKNSEHTTDKKYEEAKMWKRGMSSSSSSVRSSRQAWHTPFCKKSIRNKCQEVTDDLTDESYKGVKWKKKDKEAYYQRASSNPEPKVRDLRPVCSLEDEELLEADVYMEKLRANIDNKETTGKRKSFIIGYPSLKNLLGKDPEYIILELTKTKSSLKDCIGRTSHEIEFFKLFLRVVSKAFTSSKTPKNMISLFETLREERFFDTVILYLIDIMGMANEKNINDSETEEILTIIMRIISEQITRNPSSFRVFGRLSTVIGQVIETLMKYGSVDDSVVLKHKEIVEERKTLEKSQPTNYTGVYNQKPPDDFRLYPISPSPAEITGTARPFLRQNKVDGRYDDLDHYLDVQFRLLREDFVGPLREGITAYIKLSTLKGQTKQMMDQGVKDLDIKIYENVRVHTPVVNEHGLCYKLQLEMNKRLRQINWAFSKRLIYGSMVCLSDNDFNTFYLATVVGRDEQDIKSGFFTVRFEQEDVKTHDILQKVFRVAESSAYFESYRHVLSSLQAFNQGDLPFEKYIVNCSTDVDPPAYLKDDCIYDLRPLTTEKYELQGERRLQNIGTTIRAQPDFKFSRNVIEAKSVPVCKQSSWPSKELLNLDESQYTAVQTALTKEFAIIQGPPGTGKTYIGLQIVKTLLHNRSVWARSRQGLRPMLVVCYTNHALDQFLEGIHKFFKGDILRVGGRSESSMLKNCNIKSYRQTHHTPRSHLGRLQKNRKQAQEDLEQLSLSLQELATKIEVYSSEIVGENTLRSVMGENLYISLEFGFRGRQEEENGFSYIVEWLGIKHIQERCRQTAQNTTDQTRDDLLVNVEDDMQYRRRNFEYDEDNRKKFEEKAKTLLQEIRRMSGIVFFVDRDKCTIMQEDISEEKRNEIKFNRLLKATIEQKISDSDVMNQEEVETIQDVWRLDHNAKWRLYRFWIRQFCLKEYNMIETQRSQFEEASERYREALVQEEKEIMKLASVIGMTTSSAARYQAVLREIGPRIIVVEEAAEVLEAHIITTLSKGCEHLILIGDHKQLRPNPNVYKLAIRYKLNISLFERMIINGMRHHCLEQQHRMRPTISNIVRHIYPDLKDHDHVQEYPDVKGISINVCLINHNCPENTDVDVRSYSNVHEAQYVAALCRYLLLQGYERNQITILTTYTGQLMCMRKFMPREEFGGVKVRVVDNYQGEENEIIILSLVRSNDYQKIGFLKTENRICVALSRAKVGFYAVGNFHHLAANSLLWKSIVDDMKDKSFFGDGLNLFCQNHPVKQPIFAKSHEDFKNAPEGGCSEICNIRLDCGHKCRKHCHVLDKTHREYKCKQNCTKILCDLGHICPDKCFEKCGRCNVPVSKTMPLCGHNQTMQCCVEPRNFSCKAPCAKILKCGHKCNKACGETHTTECMEDISYTWPCGHTYSIKCCQTNHKDIQVQCPHPCGAILKCEHVCSGTCGKCFTGRVHVSCQHECKRLLVCGHECKDACKYCSPCKEKCQNRCVHSICDKVCGEPCSPCKEPCSWQCKHYKCTKLCSEPCDRPRCNKPCTNILTCKHACIGLCGEPCPSLCRICNEETVKEIFFGNEDEPDAKFVLLEDCQHIVESEKMDEYMEMEEETFSIKVKSCPLCKTPIRKCLRYGKIINTVLRDIERIKQEVIGENTRIGPVKKKIKQLTETVYDHRAGNLRAQRQSSTDVRKKQCSLALESKISNLELEGFYTETQLNTIENQCIIAVAIIDLIQKIKSNISTKVNENEQKLLSFLKAMLKVVLNERDYFTEQEIDDVQREIARAKIYAKYLHLIKGKNITAENFKNAPNVVQRIRSLVFSTSIFSKGASERADKYIDYLRTILKAGGLGITEGERLEIIKAVALSKGHWFKCANNHIYAVGECGGPTEKSNCPECKAEIGGVQHKLTEGNKLAPEMDGASYAAYSEEANNMANFDLNNLR